MDVRFGSHDPWERTVHKNVHCLGIEAIYHEADPYNVCDGKSLLPR